MKQHPGQVAFYEGSTLVKRVPVSEVPETVRFGHDAHGVEVPMVKVVMRTAGGRRTVDELGPDGQLLRSTVARG